MGRKWKIVLFVVFLLILGLYFSLRSDLVSEPLKRAALRSLLSNVPLSVEVATFSLDLFPTALVLSDVNVAHPEGKRKPFLNVKEVRLAFSPWSLLTEVTILKKISLTEPHFDFVQTDTETGWIPWPSTKSGPLSPDSLRKPTVVVIREIELLRGNLSFRSSPADLRLEMTGIEVNIVPDLRMGEFQVHLTGEETIIQTSRFERRFNQAVADFSIHPDSIDIKKATLTAPEVQLAMEGTVSNLVTMDSIMKFDASFPLSELNTFFENMPVMAGRAHLQGQLVREKKALTVSGDTRVTSLALNNHPIGKIESSFNFDKQRLVLSNLSSSAFNGKVQGKGMLEFSASPPTYQFSLAFERVSAGSVTTLFDRSGFFPDHLLEGQIEVAGQGLNRESLSGKGNLELRLPQSSARRPKAANWNDWINQARVISARFEVDQGILNLKEGITRSPRSRFQLSGLLDLKDEFDMGFSLISQEIHEFTSLLKIGFLRGAIDMEGSIHGTIENPELIAEGTMKNASIKKRHFETISGHIQYKHPTLTFADVRFQEGGAQYDLDGLISFDSSFPARPFFDFEASISQGVPREVVSIFYRELPISSEVSGSLKARGHPKQFELTADLTVGPGEIYGQSIDSGRLNLMVTRRKVSFGNVKAKYRNSDVSGTGWIEYNGKFDFGVFSPKTDLHDIDWARTHLRDVSTHLSGEFRGNGLLKNPNFQGKFQLGDFHYRDQSYGSGSFNGTIADKQLVFLMGLENGLSANGTLALSPPFPFKTALFMNQFQAKPLLNMLNVSKMIKLNEITTIASGSLNAQGTLNKLSETTLRLHLNQFQLDLGDYSLSNVGEIIIQMEEGKVDIESLQLKGEGSRFTVTGGFEVFEAYNLLIEGEASLDLLRSYSQEVVFGRGTLNAAIRIENAWENPTLRGNLNLKDGIIKSRTLDQIVTIQNINLSFDKRQILLDSFDGKIGGGEVTVNGKWDLDGLEIKKIGINLELRSIRPATLITGLSGSIDASLFFHGNGKTKNLNGEVLIQRASYDRRLDWKAFTLELLKREQRKPGPLNPLGDTTLNIQPGKHCH